MAWFARPLSKFSTSGEFRSAASGGFGMIRPAGLRNAALQALKIGRSIALRRVGGTRLVTDHGGLRDRSASQMAVKPKPLYETSSNVADVPHPRTVIPIADLDETTAWKYSVAETIVRNKLAALYRVIDLAGWSDRIDGHSSVRVPGADGEFLLNPYGFLYHEMTASSLVKVNSDGDIIDPGSTDLGINKTCYVIHSAIYNSRPDINCVIHVHPRAGVAVSCMKCGVLPISQDALILGKVSYHPFRGVAVATDEREEIARDVGTESKVLVLLNHGLVTLGNTPDEALFYMNNLVNACEFQIGALAMGLDNVIVPDVDALTTVGVGCSQLEWGRGELEWEAEMRKLDMQGYRTGQIYKTLSLIHSPANQL